MTISVFFETELEISENEEDQICGNGTVICSENCDFFRITDEDCAYCFKNIGYRTGDKIVPDCGCPIFNLQVGRYEFEMKLKNQIVKQN